MSQDRGRAQGIVFLEHLFHFRVDQVYRELLHAIVVALGTLPLAAADAIHVELEIDAANGRVLAVFSLQMVGKDDKQFFLKQLLQQNIGRISIFFSVFVKAYNYFMT